MGPYIKYDRKLGGGGVWQIAVSNSNCDVMLFSNNGIILQSEGEGVKKGQKIAVILNAWPLVVIAIERDRWVTQIYISTATDCDFIQDFLTTWEVTVYSC